MLCAHISHPVDMSGRFRIAICVLLIPEKLIKVKEDEGTPALVCRNDVIAAMVVASLKALAASFHRSLKLSALRARGIHTARAISFAKRTVRLRTVHWKAINVLDTNTCKWQHVDVGALHRRCLACVSIDERLSDAGHGLHFKHRAPLVSKLAFPARNRKLAHVMSTLAHPPAMSPGQRFTVV